MDEAELRKLLITEQEMIIVDIREREAFEEKSFDNAINIPYDELNIRASNEISTSDTLIIYGKSNYDSAEAQKILVDQGFRKVFILRSLDWLHNSN